MNTAAKATWVLATVAVLASASHANWADSFDGGQFNLDWKWLSYPQVAGTFTQELVTTADGNTYVALKETTSVGAPAPGAAFGVGFGSEMAFTDVRVAATVNVEGDASRSYHGLATRSSYVVNDGKIVPGAAPGIVASCYIMQINWEDGPANLRINVQKVVNLSHVMRESGAFTVVVPGLAHARSYYAALDVMGADPVYILGSLYEYKGGPLLAQAPLLIDTDGNDPWERPDRGDKVFKSGPSGIFAQNERPAPAGFYATFDDISSTSDGPPAIRLGPADGAINVSLQTTLSWVEAKYATGRQLWFGPAGDMQLVDPAPAGASYATGPLEAGQPYQWRVDLVGAGGTVTGDVWQFTTGQAVVVDDFESYASTAQIAAAWPHNIAGGFEYVFLETATINQGVRAMKFDCQNQYEPFFTEATRTFAAPQDWTVKGVDMLSLDFRGHRQNFEQPLFVRIEDAAGNEARVDHSFTYAIQSEPWRTWDVPLAEFADVDLTAVKALTIGVGGGTASSGQPDEDVDTIYIDNIRLGFLPEGQ
jgi:hypothetical protein